MTKCYGAACSNFLGKRRLSRRGFKKVPSALVRGKLVLSAADRSKCCDVDVASFITLCDSGNQEI